MKLLRRKSKPHKLVLQPLEAFEMDREAYLLTEYTWNSDGEVHLTLEPAANVLERFQSVVDVVREFDMRELGDAFRD